jgi:hypothetical protein
LPRQQKATTPSIFVDLGRDNSIGRLLLECASRRKIGHDVAQKKTASGTLGAPDAVNVNWLD